MPFVSNRGQQIHYAVAGDGPLVVLQHGFLASGGDWARFGHVDVLLDAGFQVASVDALAHGESDKPADVDLYALPQRADDIVAVIDDLGAARAHLVGYSMGGWIAGGVATHHPDRLASVTIAGWDCVRGVATAAEVMGVTVDAELLLEEARAVAPALLDWVTPDIEPAVLACGRALLESDPDASAALDALGVPVLCWNGEDDPYHSTMSQWAPAHGHQYFSVPGDHLGAFYLNAADTAAQIADFLRAREQM